MYIHFGYIGENLKVYIFLSSDFAKCRPYVIRIRIKWLTERFYTDAFTYEIYADTDTDVKHSANVFNLFHFLSGYAMRILILIRRRRIGA